MTKEIGCYSLIQYCPDISVAEVANIGVLLFVPKTGFVDVRVTSSNGRVSRIFGGGIHKYDAFQLYKEGLPSWAKTASGKLTSVEDANHFLASYVNSIVFTPVRSVICPEGGDKMLDSLFAKFFPEEVTAKTEQSKRGRYAPRKHLIKALQKKCGDEIAVKLAILPELEVVGHEKRVQPVFAFQNKHFNVVFPKAFNSERYDEQIGFGLLIASVMKMSDTQYWKQSVPVILGRIPKSKHDLARDIADALNRCSIDFYASEQRLVDYIAKEAKPLPLFAREFSAVKVEPSLFDHAS